MVWIEVKGDRFNLPESDIVGSRVIEDLLQYRELEDNEAIVVKVEPRDWYKYVNFLLHDIPSFGALKVIDYLDNVEQARRWVVAEREELETNRHYLLDYYLDAYGKRRSVRNKLVEIINQYTQFDPIELLPTDLLMGIDDIVSYIKSLGDQQISLEFAKYIVDELFSRRMNYVYSDDSHDNDINERTSKQLNESIIEKLIIKSPYLANDYIADDNRVLSLVENPYYSDSKYGKSFELRIRGDAELITPRVAAYYDNITTYSVWSFYVYCPEHKPYLRVTEDTEITASHRYLLAYKVSCSDHISSPSHETHESYETEEGKSYAKRVDLYSAKSKYRPGEGFPTGIKLKSTIMNGNNHKYTLMSYNMPSTYDRNYYIFIPYDFDPIAKFVYAFSV